ncbi:hypothetical protein COU74_00120 [Candidatus Peregrinibacteria bacterium CG10_big_fil_rev_8_21_14_0_10_36_19]|nr:MAG: hypothetical protein COU74_00120 [Candidatus Peregrinibacteria bacterium CG10_big_fil_rev_8_21_14_0_10_36_19]
MKNLFLVLSLSAVLLTACGSPSSPVVEEVANVPEGCPNKTNLTVSSKEVSSFEALKGYFITWGEGLDKPYLVFSNFNDLDPSNIYGHSVTGTEALVVVKPTKLDGTTVNLGKYTKEEGDNSKLGEVNISTEKLAGGVFDKTANLEITYFGSDYVCGKIKADDSYSKVIGEFITQTHHVDL